MTVFELNRTVSAADCDGLGHVNNVRYLAWAEELAWAHSAALGLGLARYRELDAAMVAREHVLTYLAACFAGDELRLQTRLSGNDGLRLRREYAFYRGELRVFQGHTDWVCVRLSSGKARKMPPEFRRAYALPDTAVNVF